MKSAIIINPAAGRGKSRKHWLKIKRIIQTNNLIFQEYFTEGPGHAVEIAGQLEKKGFNKIIVVGGDGTLHEVINGLNSKKIILGMIPTGTGNDFSRTVGISRIPEKAAEQILLNGQAVDIDLGMINKKLFVNVAGIGFDAQVAEEINTSFKWLSGVPAYLLAVLKLLRKYRNIPLEINLDNKDVFTVKAFLLAVGNAQYYGGGIRIIPTAVIDDGFLNVCIAGDASKFEILTAIPKAFSGKHLEHDKVTAYKAKKITISSSIPAPIHADGEVVGYLPAVIELFPEKQKFLIPNKEGNKSSQKEINKEIV